jgi:hypothetical protein
MNRINVGRGLAAAIVLVAMSGVAIAADAAAKSSGYTACANSKHQLAVSKHGKCAKHFHKVSVGARGAAGARGPSDVYVASGNFDAAGPAVQPQSHISPAATLQLSLPAGSYLVSWQVQDLGSKAVFTNATAPYTLDVNCEPGASNHGGIGQDDVVNSTVVPDNYDAAMTETRYDFIAQMSDFWAVTIPQGGAQITMNCSPPILIDHDGFSSAADSNALSGQIEATRTTKIHGSDPGEL